MHFSVVSIDVLVDFHCHAYLCGSFKSHELFLYNIIYIEMDLRYGFMHGFYVAYVDMNIPFVRYVELWKLDTSMCSYRYMMMTKNLYDV